MCQARVVLKKGEGEEELMRDVVELEVRDDGVHLKAFFEAPKVVKARLVKIDFLKHKVLLEEE